MTRDDHDPEDEQLAVAVNAARKNQAMVFIAIGAVLWTMSFASLNTSLPIEARMLSATFLGGLALFYVGYGFSAFDSRLRSLVSLVTDPPRPVNKDLLKQAGDDDFWRGEGR
jgi:hypothetical protein